MGDALGDFLALEDFVASGLFLRRACASFAAATSIKNGNTRRLRFMISIAVALIINFYDIERKIDCLFLLKQIRFHNYPNLIQMDLWMDFITMNPSSSYFVIFWFMMTSLFANEVLYGVGYDTSLL